MKKIILPLISAVFFGAIFAIFPPNANENFARAADYEITVENNQATKNQEFVFEYRDIAPGFSADAPLKIVNLADSAAEIKLLGVEEVPETVAGKPAPANNLLPYVNLNLSRDGGVILAQGTLANSANLVGATICVPAQKTEILNSHLDLPAKIGNEAQNSSLYIRYIFQISIGPCGISTPAAQPDNIKPPNTSETALPFLVMGGTFSAAFFVALIFCAILVISVLKRKKNDKKISEKH